MADEIVHDAPEAGAEVTDLRSTIMAAVEAQRAPVADETDPEPIEAKETKPAGDKPETEAERNERLRDDKGRFAKGDEKPEADKPDPAKPVIAKVDGTEPVKAEPAVEDKPALRPPPGWSPTAKVAFDKLPPEVQQAVAQREAEVNKGFEKLAAYKPLDQYMEMAQRGGTTLPKALESYVGIENELNRDMVSGVARICQNKGIHPVALANQILARHGVSPTQNGEAGEAPADQKAPGVDLSPVMQKISALENFIQQQQQAGVQTEIQRFASDPKHTFFENVKVQMGQLISSGQAEDLEDAYDKACWANKEIRTLLIKQQSAPVPSANAADAVSRAKAAAKATGGAPSAGFKPNAGAEGGSIRDTIRAAVNQQRGI